MKWFKFITREYNPASSAPLIRAMIEPLKQKGVSPVTNQLYIKNKTKYDFCFNQTEFNGMLTSIKKRCTKEYTQNFIRDAIASCERAEATAHKLSNKPKEITNSQLTGRFKKYLKDYMDYYCYIWIKYPVMEFIEEKLKENIKDAKDFAAVSTKLKKSSADQEIIDLLEVAKDYDEGKLKKHAKKYAWLPFYGLELIKWSEEDFKKRASEFKDPASELAKLRQEEKENKQKLEAVRKKQDKETQGYIDIYQSLLWLRNELTDSLRKQFWHWSAFLQEVSKRTGFSYDELIYLTPEEMTSVLLMREEANKRMKNCLFRCLDGKLDIISDEERIKQITEEAFPKQEIANIQGTPVFPGIVEGIARIIFDIREIEKLQAGDVLIAPMTTPDMTLALRKVVAVVTDEGGLGCHAAIIARELKVPCIIGTKNASKLLKDGDLIRVDAAKGIVEKISR